MRRTRIIDPREATQGYAGKRLGVQSQRQMQEAIGAGDRGAVRSAVPVIVFETITFYDFNIAVTDRADSLFAASASTVALAANLQLYLGRPGRLVSCRLTLNDTRTAGTLTGGARIIEAGTTTDYDFEDCVIDGMNTQTIHHALDWGGGVPFDAAATICGRITFSGFTPTTADARLDLVVGYEDAKL